MQPLIDLGFEPMHFDKTKPVRPAGACCQWRRIPPR